MKSKTITMDNTNFVQAKDGNITVKPQNLTTCLVIIVFAPIVLFLFLEMLTELLHGNFEWKSISLTLGMAMLLFAFIRSWRKNTINVDVSSRIIEIKQGAESQQISFSRVSFIALYKGAYYDFKKGIQILAVLNSKEVISFGKISGFNEKNALSRAETIAQLLAHTIGVEVRQDVQSE